MKHKRDEFIVSAVLDSSSQEFGLLSTKKWIPRLFNT